MGLTQLLTGLLPLVAPTAAETVLGAYIFHRHGDRSAKSLPPVGLTALGADECYTSGSYYRRRYVADNSSSQILNIQPDVVRASQLEVVAPVDNVLYPSAQTFLQGLYPPAGAAAAQTLANGSTVEAPLGGYQYISISASSGVAAASSSSSSSSESNVWLQGSTGCNNAEVSSNNYFKTPEFLSTQSRTAAFYQSMLPVINGTFTQSQADFKNAYTIWDLVHVSTIHNQTIPSSSLLTDANLHQLQTLADVHEWGLAYNASDPIRAISGAVLAGQILASLNATMAQAPAKKAADRFGMQFGAYGTFMSFFGLANLTAASPDFYGVVDYASSLAFELVTNATVDAASADPVPAADVSVRFLLANGSASDANPPRAYPLFGRGEALLPWADFAAGMERIAVASTQQWCAACGNTDGTCAAYANSTSSGSGSSGSAGTTSEGASGGGGGGVSRPVAGVIGALVTLVVILGVEALVMAVGGLRLIRKGSQVPAAAAGGAAGGAGGVKA